ncbi:VOC family protein [Ruoffia halotolerans]|uniref:VOC family protein n=1 Tax=Ruoffia halotolerans TaxID=2748684 RepID=UPI001F45488F|nr:VOC family protein [Ruoffia halotolerans]
MNRINLIALGVKNIGKAMKFYKEISFKTYEEADNPPIVFFDMEGTKLELFSLENLANEINPTNPPVINTGLVEYISNQL